MVKLFAVAGTVSAFVAVALGAFGAHALAERLPARDLATFETAVRYQMYHALALLAAAWIATRWPVSAAVWGGWAFMVGTVLFSGSLYLLVLADLRWMGAVTPVGGVCFLFGWAALTWAIVQG